GGTGTDQILGSAQKRRGVRPPIGLARHLGSRDGGLKAREARHLTGSPAREPACVAGALIEAGLELATAFVLASVGIHPRGRGRDRGKRATDAIAGAKAVIADALVAGAAKSRSVLAGRNRTAAGAGADARRIDLGPAMIDAGGTRRGAIGLRRGGAGGEQKKQ